MKIVLALNSFKDSCNSIEANETLKKGLAKHISKNDITVFPLFDGGDGSVAALHYHLGFKKIKTSTIDALGNPIQTYYLLDQKKNIAYIELALASGIAMIGKEKNNILNANTSGTGLLIKHAISRAVSKIVLLIGGSATNDAGLGALHALGIKLLDNGGNQVVPFPGQFHRINKLDTSGVIKIQIPIEIWSDVTNPFTGIAGAVSIFSAQKGASEKDQIILEKSMLNIQSIIQRDFHIDLNKVKGAGAAGGIGAGFHAILGSSIIPCTSAIFEMLRLRDLLQSQDLIITGEGSLDQQSMYGKLVYGICKESRKLKKPVIGVCGSNSLSGWEMKKLGMKAVFSIVQGPCSLDLALKSWKNNMFTMGERLGTILQMNKY